MAHWRQSAAIPVGIALGIACGSVAFLSRALGVGMMLNLSVLGPAAFGYFFWRRHVAAAMIFNGLVLAIPIIGNLLTMPNRRAPYGREWVGLFILIGLSMAAAQLSRLGAMLRNRQGMEREDGAKR